MGLLKYVSVVYADHSYNWELMKLIEQNTEHGVCSPVFDFCFVDGAHTWETDGFAFFLVSKLFKKGGIMVFDDLRWSVATSPIFMNTEYSRSLPPEECDAQQVWKIFDLLVKQSPLFGNFTIDESAGIAWCRKTAC